MTHPPDVAALAQAIGEFSAAVRRASDACDRADLLALSRALDESEHVVARAGGLVAAARVGASAESIVALSGELARARQAAATLSQQLSLATEDARGQLVRLGHESAAVHGYAASAAPPVSRLDRRR